jgi:ferredoxin
MKLAVDAQKCSGHGRCYTVAPELLEPDDDGFVTIRGSAVDLPPGSAADARKAADWCPEGAITLTDD